MGSGYASGAGSARGRRQGALALNFLSQQPPKAVVNAPNPHDKAGLLDELLDARIEQAVVVRHTKNRTHCGIARLQCFDRAPEHVASQTNMNQTSSGPLRADDTDQYDSAK